MTQRNSGRNLAWLLVLTIILSSTLISPGFATHTSRNTTMAGLSPTLTKATAPDLVLITEKDIEGLMVQAHKAYLRRETALYRILIFALQNESRAFNGPLLAAHMRLLTRVGKQGSFDGLETIALTYFDLFAQLDPGQGKTSKKSLRRQVRYTGNPAVGLPVPFARSRSRFVIDIRADAMRELFNNLLAGQSLGFLDLLGTPGTHKRICQLPTRTDDQGQIPRQEKERQDNCRTGGSAGKPGGGVVSTALGPLVESGCFGGGFKENQWMEQRLSDMEECENTRDAQRMGAGAKTPASVLTAALIGGAVIAGGALILCLVNETCRGLILSVVIPEGVKLYLEKGKREHEAHMEVLKHSLEEATKASSEAVAADKELNEANATLAKEQVELDARKGELGQLEETLRDSPPPPGGDLRALQESVRQKEDEVKAQQAKVDKAKIDAEKAKKNAEEAKARNEKAEKEVKDAANAAASDFAEPYSLPGSACERLAFGGINLGDPTVVRKMSDDWKTFYGRIKNKINPVPDGPMTDALAMHDYCGIDSQTTSNSGAGCNSLIVCEAGKVRNEDCKCVNGASGKPLREDLGCQHTDCPPDKSPVPHGVMCGCESAEERAPLGPRPPLPIVLKTLFEDLPSSSQPARPVDLQSYLQSMVFMNSPAKSFVSPR